MHFLLAQLAACGTTTPETTEPPSATDQKADGAEAEAQPITARTVTEGPSNPLPYGEVISKLAKAHGVGAVQCPVPGIGRIKRIHGTERDFAVQIGPTWLVEVDDDVPWNPTYDEVTIEDGWVTVLAKPGSTEGFVRSKTWTLRLEWPPAEAEKTLTCTKVEPVTERVVVGTVTPREASMYALGCSKEAVEVARDGTFVVDAQVPCSLWLETDDAHRTPAVVIPIGEEKLKLDPMDYQADPLQNADRTWTDEGKKALDAVVRKTEKDLNWQRETLSAIEAELEPDAKNQRALLRRWNGLIGKWGETTQYLKEGLAGTGPL